MLVIDRVELVPLDQPQQVRQLDGDDARGREQLLDAGDEVVQRREPAPGRCWRRSDPPCARLASRRAHCSPKNATSRRHPAAAGRRSDVGGRLDAEHRDTDRRRSTGADSRRCCRARRRGCRPSRPNRRCAMAAYRLACSTQRVGVGREVRVVREHLLRADERLELDEEAAPADPGVQGIDGFRLVAGGGADVALAEGSRPEVDERMAQRFGAEAARRLRLHGLSPRLVLGGAGGTGAA